MRDRGLPRGCGAVRLAVLMAGLCLAAPPAAEVAVAASSEKPRRIVSINLCTDQIVLDLVARERIAALSHLAADPAVSAAHEQARGLPATRGEAEHVLGFDPDLVLAGTFSTPATVSLLERVGRRVVKVPLAGDIDGIRTAIRSVAAAVDEAARGEALIAALERRLGAIDSAGASADHARRPSALVYQVNGLASGAGSLADALLEAAGLLNHAARLGLGSGGTVSLEAIVADPPDLLVLSGPVDEYRTSVADNLRHPALAELRRSRASVVVPWRTWLCGTQHVTDAVAGLAAARAALGPARGKP